MVYYQIFGFLISSVIIVKAGGQAIKALTAIGKNLDIGHFILSFFFVGMVSALPEGFVASISAFRGVPHLGFGTLVGSVIADLSLVIGLVALSAGRTKITKGFTYELWLFALMALLLAFGIDGTISRTDGTILIGGCFLFFYTLLQKNHIVEKLVHSDKRHLIKQLVIFAVSALIVLASANYVVEFSKGIALEFSLPLVVVGLIIIALATSLPETVFAITAARQKMADLAIGELFGVIIIDGTLLVGIVALIHPITLPAAELVKIAVFLLTAIALATYFIRRGRILTWRDGLFMVFFYILLVITELALVKTIPT